MAQLSHTDFGTKNRQINYLVQGFEDFKQSTLLRIKQYYPDRINLFAQDSDGDIFLQLNRRIGDILKFQLNSALNESQLDTAKNRQNIFNIGKANGFYDLKNTPAFGFIDISYTVPVNSVSSGIILDSNYIPTIKRGSLITVNGSATYIINNDVVFVANSTTAGDQQIQSIDANTYKITKKDVYVMRGNFETFSAIIDQNSSLGNFFRVRLPRADVTSIVSVQTGALQTGTSDAVFEDDSSLNHWYQYPYLAQRSIFQVVNQGDVQKFVQIDTPYKYVVQYDSNGNTYLVFGPGRSFINNARNISAFKNVYAPMSGYTGVSQQVISPQSFLFSSSLGYSPGDTNNKVLRVKYVYGGGPATNVQRNTQFTAVSLNFSGVSSSARNVISNTMTIVNRDKIAGGMRQRNIDQVKQLIKRRRNSQGRIVNSQDFVCRIKMRPNIYGGNVSVNVHKTNGFTTIYLANRTVDNRAVQNISQSIKNLNKVNYMRYLGKFALLDDTFQIQYRDVKNIIVNFSVSIYDFQNKQNVQNDIALKILQMFQNGSIKFQVGQDVDFNIVVDYIRNYFKAVKTMGQVIVINKSTGRSLSVINGLLSSYNYKTVYNISDFFSDITLTLI